MMAIRKSTVYALDIDHSPGSKSGSLWCYEIQQNGGLGNTCTYARVNEDGEFSLHLRGPITVLATKAGFGYIDEWVLDNIELVELLLRKAGHHIDYLVKRLSP